jgi:hypothetical protein
LAARTALFRSVTRQPGKLLVGNRFGAAFETKMAMSFFVIPEIGGRNALMPVAFVGVA